MLRLSPSRKARTGGFKVKHAGQICLLLTVFIWLLYQVRHSYYNNMEHKEPSPELLLSDGIETREEVIKLGRKDLLKPLSDGSSVKRGQEKEEGSGEGGRDAKVEGEEEEEEEEENVVEGRGGGDDEIDVNDQERGEEEDPEAELEDFIDQLDREKEDATSEDEITSHSGRAKDGSKENSEEDENDTQDPTLKLVKTQGLGSDNGEDVSNREDALFFRDRLVDQIENSDRDAAKKFSSRAILL